MPIVDLVADLGESFGSRTMWNDAELLDLLTSANIAAFARAHGGAITHLSPHGRLGNVVVTRRDYATAIADAVEAFDPSLVILMQEGAMAEVAREHGLGIAMVGMADRAYADDGTLVPRSEPGSVLHDPDEVTARTAVDQLQWGPGDFDPEFADAARERGIVSAHSSLRSTDLADPILVEIAQRHGRTVPEVVIRWNVHHGVAVTVKSARRERMEQNLAVPGFALTQDEVGAIDSISGTPPGRVRGPRA